MFMNGEIPGFLRYLNNISPLSEGAQAALIPLLRVEGIPAKHTLQAINSSCKTLYFIQEGAARIYYFKDDKDVTEYFALSQSMIIRAESLFSGLPTVKGIETILPSTIISIPAHFFFKTFSEWPEIERLFHLLIRASYLETLVRLEQLQFNTAHERYQKLLEASPELVQKIPLKHIASFLGITQVSLSRIRADLR